MDPITREQWQEAATLANAALLIHSAEAYGLIDGGPRIDTDRCHWILQEALEVHKIKPVTGSELVLCVAWNLFARDVRRAREKGSKDAG